MTALSGRPVVGKIYSSNSQQNVAVAIAVVFFLNKIYDCVFIIGEIALYIYKGTFLPYEASDIGLEAALLALLVILDSLRFAFGAKGYLTQRLAALSLCLLLTPAVILGDGRYRRSHDRRDGRSKGLTTGETESIEGLMTEEMESLEGLTTGETEGIEGLTTEETEDIEGLTAGETEDIDGLTTGETEGIEGLTIGETKSIEGLMTEETEDIEGLMTEETEGAKIGIHVMIWQTYVIRIDYIFGAILVSFHALEFCLLLLASLMCMM
ncbi:hypothetical protein BV898_17299 [Hypsibius exemplaris]|uniref:Uncharacterized protein n=1 Tax=Hypsibius exemplaris TaxID=2072580 RepID=A0A9X6NES4_HYPEX|nr:hypothetical protein BV898_17299 [Hypsibius exemplaris]